MSTKQIPRSWATMSLAECGAATLGPPVQIPPKSHNYSILFGKPVLYFKKKKRQLRLHIDFKDTNHLGGSVGTIFALLRASV